MIRNIVFTAVFFFWLCSPASGAIIDNHDGTATDDATGLMWQTDDILDGVTWDVALAACENSTVAGLTDWRLPDRNEFLSVTNYESDPVIPFELKTAARHYWTSSTYAENPERAWRYTNSSGSLAGTPKTWTLPGVRCVRAGLAVTPDPSAVVTSVPDGLAGSTVMDANATFTVGGVATAKYRYRLDNGRYSKETDISEPINLSGLSPGTHTLYVLGVNSGGKLQVRDTTVTWTVSAPEVLTVVSNPVNEAVDVAPDTAVVLTFSKEMDTSTADLSISPGLTLEYTTSWSADKKTLTAAFNQDLAASTKYTLEIPVSAKSTDGTALTRPFEASFTTRNATEEEIEAEIGGVPTLAEIEAMLNRGGVSSPTILAIASEGVRLIPDSLALTGFKGAATGCDTDRAEACADAQSFCSVVTDINMDDHFNPADTVASVKGIRAGVAVGTSAEPQIVTLYACGYLAVGSMFFPECFKANEATVATYQYSYVRELTTFAIKEAADGDEKAGFALMNPATGRVIQPADRLPALPGGYMLLLFIRDNSRYDINSAWGTIEDPSYLTAGPPFRRFDSTGCMLNPAAGFGLEWLMVACIPVLAAWRFRFGKECAPS